MDLTHLTAPAARPGDDTAATKPQPAASEARPAASTAVGTSSERIEVGAAAAEQQQQLGEEPVEQPQGAEEILLPEELRQAPEGQCDSALQARVANWLHLQRTRGRWVRLSRLSQGVGWCGWSAKDQLPTRCASSLTCRPPHICT